MLVLLALIVSMTNLAVSFFYFLIFNKKTMYFLVFFGQIKRIEKHIPSHSAAIKVNYKI